jgi:hypothetical protein
VLALVPTHAGTSVYIAQPAVVRSSLCLPPINNHCWRNITCWSTSEVINKFMCVYTQQQCGTTPWDNCPGGTEGPLASL